MYSFSFHYRVCYADTDRMGYMYYGNYARLYEIGRVEAIRSLGLDYRKMEEEDHIILPVVALNARYLLPAKYDEVLEVKTIVPEMPGKMITFENQVYNQNGQCIHTAEIKLFFVHTISGKRITCPDSITAKLQNYFNGGNEC
ncbi:MAG: acyl-CoA thioesterase [Saprospiraceae bacterium]|jgi:acyl-CoA thioester hydrolase|nr:acyl-CoA thioesterase [Saprospiraceae bacterium]